MPRVGVVGATGAVGGVMVELLREHGFDDLRLFASSRSAGTEVGGLPVEEATPASLGGLDLCFFSVRPKPSRELVPHARKRGAVSGDPPAPLRLQQACPRVV